jgi:hypothetical protein
LPLAEIGLLWRWTINFKKCLMNDRAVLLKLLIGVDTATGKRSKGRHCSVEPLFENLYQNAMGPA